MIARIKGTTFEIPGARPSSIRAGVTISADPRHIRIPTEWVEWIEAEPPVGTYWLDNDGDVWHRMSFEDGEEWTRGSQSETFAFISEHYGPLTELVRKA